MACKAAVKDGDVLTHQEMEILVRDLYATPHYETCPHGRPTITVLTKPEMMKRFLR
jgi:DNA mismatch repair protein MutL